MQPWNYIRTVPNVVAAEMWRDLFEAEGLPCRIERLRSQAHLGGAGGLSGDGCLE